MRNGGVTPAVYFFQVLESPILTAIDTVFQHRYFLLMQKFVAGFLFDDAGRRIALIHKNRGPEGIRGKWNGVGGKVDQIDGTYESIHEAMRREFYEEAGAYLDWTHFSTLSCSDRSVDFFCAFSTEALSRVRTMEDEEVRIFDTQDQSWPSLPIVPNLAWLIPMAQRVCVGHYYMIQESPIAPQLTV